jgi:hypothetical protein
LKFLFISIVSCRFFFPFLVFSIFFGFLTSILFVYVVCVCVCGKTPTHKERGLPCPSHKGGVYLFIPALVNHLYSSGLGFGALVGCLPFVSYHNFDNGCLIDFLILI